MRILFIQDNIFNESLGLTDISALLKARGHACDLLVVDEEKDIFARIGEYSPDIIGFSCTTGIHRWALKVAGEIKKRLRVPIIFGGTHPTIFPEIIGKDCLDIICRGEGELALLELLENLEKGKDIRNIANLWVKDKGRIYKNEIRPLIQDFNEFPLPDRALYYKYPVIERLTMKRFISGRGCPYSCAFCHNPVYRELFKGKGNFIRHKSPRRMVDELLDMKKRHPLKVAHFSDDTFVVNKGWLFEFLQAYQEEVRLPFTCNVRIDLIDEETVKKLKQADCIGATFGLETGSERLRNLVLKKNIPDSAIIEKTGLLRASGIKVLTTSLLAIPGETLEEAFSTIRFNRKLRVDFTRVNVVLAFPKLELTEYAADNGFMDGKQGIDEYIQELRQPYFNSPYNREFRNLCSFFHVAVRFPWLLPLIKLLIKLPRNWFFDQFSQYVAYEEMLFFRLDFFSGFNYFLRTRRSFKCG